MSKEDCANDHVGTWRSAMGVIWAYYLVWLFMGDLAKLAVLRHLEMGSRRHQTFLRVLKHCTHPFWSVEKDSSKRTTFLSGTAEDYEARQPHTNY